MKVLATIVTSHPLIQCLFNRPVCEYSCPMSFFCKLPTMHRWRIIECFKTLSFFVFTAHNHELIEISSFDISSYLYCQLELVFINMSISTLTYPLTNVSSNYLFLLLSFLRSCLLILFHFCLHPHILIYGIFHIISTSEDQLFNRIPGPKTWPINQILLKCCSHFWFMQQPYNIVWRPSCKGRCHLNWLGWVKPLCFHKPMSSSEQPSSDYLTFQLSKPLHHQHLLGSIYTVHYHHD